MEHETLGHIAGQAVHALFVGGGTQRGHDQRLGFAAAENGRAVRARQDAGLNLDGTHFVDLAAINARAFVDNARAHNLLFQIAQNFGALAESGLVFRPGRIVLEGGQNLVLHRLAGVLAGQLFRHAHGVFNTGFQSQFAHALHQRGVFHMRRKFHLGLAGQLPQTQLRFNEGLNLLAAPLEGVNDDVFGHKERVAFHHGQGVGAGGKDDIQIAVLLLFKRRIEHELAVHAADAPAGHGAFKGQRRQHHGRGRARQRQHVGLVFLIRGNDARQNLHVLIQPLGEQRTDGTVDKTGNQRFALRRTADFAAEEAAGDTARGVHFFGILHRQREKALVELQGLGADRHEHHRAAALHPDGAVRLIGETARFKDDFLAADSGGHAGGRKNILQHVHSSFAMKGIPPKTGSGTACFVRTPLPVGTARRALRNGVIREGTRPLPESLPPTAMRSSADTAKGSRRAPLRFCGSYLRRPSFSISAR